MRVAIIESSKVINIVLASSLDSVKRVQGQIVAEAQPGTFIGDYWDGQVFTHPVQESNNETTS